MKHANEKSQTISEIEINDDDVSIDDFSLLLKLIEEAEEELRKKNSSS